MQVKLQKTFKTTPDYVEELVSDEGYTMGVYLRLGKELHECSSETATCFADYGSFDQISLALEKTNGLFIRLGRSTHRIKKKAEQAACLEALRNLDAGASDQV